MTTLLGTYDNHHASCLFYLSLLLIMMILVHQYLVLISSELFSRAFDCLLFTIGSAYFIAGVYCFDRHLVPWSVLT